MSYSALLAVLAWLSFFLFTGFAVFVVCSVKRRQTFDRYLAGTLPQVGLVLIVAGLLISLFCSVPVERDNRTDTLFQVMIEAAGAGIPESAASTPFALAAADGSALKHAGQRLKPGRSAPLNVIKYSLVAAIAGGVTAVTAILFTGALLSARRRISFPAGIQALSTFYWRPAMLTGTLLWMLLTWLLLLWTDWHVLGTTAAGTDVLALLLGFSPAATAAGLILFLFGAVRALKKKA